MFPNSLDMRAEVTFGKFSCHLIRRLQIIQFWQMSYKQISMITLTARYSNRTSHMSRDLINRNRIKFLTWFLHNEVLNCEHIWLTGFSCNSNAWGSRNEMVPRNSRCCEAIYMGFWGEYENLLGCFHLYMTNCTPQSTLLFSHLNWSLMNYVGSCRMPRTGTLRIYLSYLEITFTEWITWTSCKYAFIPLMTWTLNLFNFF